MFKSRTLDKKISIAYAMEIFFRYHGGTRTRKGANVGRKSGGLSNSERSEHAEKAGRRTADASADAKSLTAD